MPLGVTNVAHFDLQRTMRRIGAWWLTVGWSLAASAAPPTYTEHIASILTEHCAQCHRPGGIAGDRPLLDHAAAQRWAAEIRTQVVSRQMPPWYADPATSLPFSNDARLSDADVARISEWVDAGAPSGPDRPLPALPSGDNRWSHPLHRAPDAVVSMPEFSVEGKGEIPYIVRRIRVPLTEDRWISAMQARPGNAALVHHMGITEVTPPTTQAEDLAALGALARQMGLPEDALAPPVPAIADPTNPAAYDMLGIYTPGSTIEVYPADSGKLLKAGPNAFINFNVHYTATGRPETDRSQLALWFRSDPPRHQLLRVPAPGQTIIANGRELLRSDPGTKAEGTDFAIPPIPPDAAHYELIGVTAYRQAVTLYQLQPHAHMRGHDFTYAVVYPDGREQTILSVPEYDFHWQLAYQLETPLKLPAGSKLVVTGHYDNSTTNRHLLENVKEDPEGRCGPDKQAFFRHENQSWDEMFSPVIQYSIDGVDPGASTGSHAATATPVRPAESATDLLPLVETVGCLRAEADGHWRLERAATATNSATQSTTAEELATAATRHLGTARYELVGSSPFAVQRQNGRRVAVKGILTAVAGASRLSVTSLQPIGPLCVPRHD